MLSTAVSCSYVVKKKPDGYSLAKVKQIYDSVKEDNQVLLASSGDVDADGEMRIYGRMRASARPGAPHLDFQMWGFRELRSIAPEMDPRDYPFHAPSCLRSMAIWPR